MTGKTMRAATILAGAVVSMTLLGAPSQADTARAEPVVARQLTLTYAEGAFSGGVFPTECLGGSTRIAVLRERPGRDVLVGRVRPDADGAYAVPRIARAGFYYARMHADRSTAPDACAAARSNRVEVEQD